MSEDWSQLNVHKLRKRVRKQGWTGTSVLDASREELLEYLRSGERTFFKFEHVGELLVVLNATIESPNFPGKTSVRNSGKGSPGKLSNRERGRGRPRVELPTDAAAYVAAIGEAFRQGRPFRRTGPLGVYERRGEFSAPFCAISRNSHARLIKELLNNGGLQLAGGYLTA